MCSSAYHKKKIKPKRENEELHSEVIIDPMKIVVITILSTGEIKLFLKSPTEAIASVDLDLDN